MGAFLTHLTTFQHCIHGFYTQVETPKRLGSYLVIGDWGWDANVHGILAHQLGESAEVEPLTWEEQTFSWREHTVDGSEIPRPTNHRLDGAKTM